MHTVLKTHKQLFNNVASPISSYLMMWPAQVSKYKNVKEGAYLHSPNICGKKRMFEVSKENSQLSPSQQQSDE